MPGCYHVRKDGSRTKLDHDKNTNPGTTFYYCTIHHVYHCIVAKSHRRLQQPYCGECAWLFFKFPKEAAKNPACDIPAFEGPGNETDTVMISSPWCGYPDSYDIGSGDAYGGVLLSALKATLNELNGRVFNNDQTYDSRTKRARRHYTSSSRDAPSSNE